MLEKNPSTEAPSADVAHQLMKLLTTNFVQCAVEKCSRSNSAFPLKYLNCQLIHRDVTFDATFIAKMLPRIDWDALVAVAQNLGNESLPKVKPEILNLSDPENEAILKDLHTFLLETQIHEGTMVCQNCGHLYHIKNFIPNFLLPPHLA